MLQNIYEKIKKNYPINSNSTTHAIDLLYKIILSYCDSYKADFLQNNICHIEIRKNSLIIINENLEEPLKYNLESKEIDQIVQSLEYINPQPDDFFRLRVTYAYPYGCNIIAKLNSYPSNEIFISDEEKIFSE